YQQLGGHAVSSNSPAGPAAVAAPTAPAKAAATPMAPAPAVATVSANPAATPPAAAPKPPADAGSIRVATEKVDALINLVGELVITQSMLGQFAEKYEPADLEAMRRGLIQLSR